MILSLQPEFADQGSASPGCCYFCRAAKRAGDPGIVDYHLQVDVAVFDGSAMDGWLQSCVACAEEIGRLVGQIGAKQAQKLRDENAELSRRYAEAQIRADAAEAALDGLRRFDAVKDASGN